MEPDIQKKDKMRLGMLNMLRFLYMCTYILLGCLAASSAFACVIPVERSTWTKEQLVTNTKTILLVKVVGNKTVDEHLTRWQFSVLQAIKGSSDSYIELELTKAPKSYVEVHFDNHRSDEFWSGRYGRLPWVPGSCFPSYVFQLDGKYLLFLESFANGASAERINNEDDKWLKYVKTVVSE